MLKRFNELRREAARDAARHEENLRAIVGEEAMNTRTARLFRKGITVSTMGHAFAPAIAFVLVLVSGAFTTAFGFQPAPKPFDADSGQLGRTIVAIIKWVFIGLLCISAGGIALTIINGIQGKEWQGKLGWSIAGFCASGIVVWAMTAGRGEDPTFDTSGLGR